MFYFLLPENVELISFSWLIAALSILSLVFLPRMTKSANRNSRRLSINLGVLYFSAMGLIIVVGNLSAYIIKYVYSEYDVDLQATNLYWLAGMFFFSVGFLFYSGRKKNKIPELIRILALNKKIIILIFMLVVLGTAVAYISIGFVPFIEGVGSGERYSSDAAGTVFDRLWSFCVVSASLAYIYVRKIHRYPLAYFIIGASIILSLFYIIRMYPALTLLSLFLLWLIFEKRRSRIIITAIFAIIIFFVFNIVFVDYRSDSALTKVQESQELNFVQRRLIYGTFNEFDQLKYAINNYDEVPQYGKTLIAIPLGFVPGPLLLAIGIEKSEIMRNNSAVIMAKYMKSKTSSGVRIGILGEFFINFRFYGCILLIFIGIFVGYLQNKINTVSFGDWRLAFYVIYFGIMMYALIGQIDGISSLLGNYILLFILIKAFSRKRAVSVNVIKYH